MTEEKWRETVGGYLISNCGNVKKPKGRDRSGHNRKEKELKPELSAWGYYRIGLFVDGVKKKYAVHRLVAKAFCPGEKEGLQVNHIDGNKQNNNASNLEWVTASENQRHAYRTGLKDKKINNPLSSKKVAQYTKDNKLLKIYPSSKEVERQTGFLRSNVCAVCRRGRKTAYGFKWKYVES